MILDQLANAQIVGKEEEMNRCLSYKSSSFLFLESDSPYPKLTQWGWWDLDRRREYFKLESKIKQGFISIEYYTITSLDEASEHVLLCAHTEEDNVSISVPVNIGESVVSLKREAFANVEIEEIFGQAEQKMKGCKNLDC
ncbi:hypothetical protein ACTXT7_002406 [Hymenolepis weldensis]